MAFNEAQFNKALEALTAEGVAEEEIFAALEGMSDAELDNFSSQILGGQEALARVAGPQKSERQQMQEEGLATGQIVRRGQATFIPDTAEEPGLIEQAGRATIEALPLSGAVAGGLIGGSTAGAASLGVGTGPGALIGATGGGAAGAAIQNILQRIFFPEDAPKSTAEAFQRTAEGAVEGAFQEVGGLVLGPSLRFVGQGGKAIAGGIREAASRVAGGAFQAGAQVGAALGVPGARKVAAVLSDDAAAASARVLRKTLKPIQEGARKVGAELAKSYDKVDETLAIAEREGGKKIRPTASELRATVEKTILDAKDALGKDVPGSFFKVLKRQMDDWFTEAPGTQMTIQKIWNKAKSIDNKAGTFTKSTAPIDQSIAGVLQSMSSALRGQLDDLVVRAGDGELAQTIAQQASDFGLLAEGRRELSKKLARAAKKETVQLAKNRAAQVLSHGPERLGKFYRILENAAGRGLGAVVAKHADLLNTSEEYVELLEQIEQEEAN